MITRPCITSILLLNEKQKIYFILAKNIIPLHGSLDFLPDKESRMLVSFSALRTDLLLNRMKIVYRGWSELSTATYIV